jgi:hypothetical protein
MVASQVPRLISIRRSSQYGKISGAVEAQLDFGDTGRDVDAGLLPSRERLQLDCAG